MSRFSVIKSKGKFYVVAKDTNTLAGGPFLSPEEAGQRSDRLNVLEVAQAVELKKRQAAAAANQMPITPGYRSPDVEDGRLALPPPGSGWASYDWWQHPPKLGDRPPRGPVSPGMKHHLPIDPAEDAKTMDDALRAADKIQANNRGLGTPGGMFDWAPGSTGFAPSVPGAGGPFDWKLDADQAELAKRQAPPPKGKP